MSQKKFIGLVVGIIALGLIIGLAVNARITLFSQTSDTASTGLSGPLLEEKQIGTRLPLSTPSAYSNKIESIDDQHIFISGRKGTLRFSKSKVKIFRGSTDQLIPLSLGDLKVGQGVIIKPVVSGKETHLIIKD